jgi:hypothetical protein
MIAFGAGFTIPIINLFFYHVHDMQADVFSLMNVFAFILVTFGAFLIPHIKARWGYKFSITFFQGASIVALFVLGTTEWYKGWHGAIIVAIVAFIVRQPLMNIACSYDLRAYYEICRREEPWNHLCAHCGDMERELVCECTDICHTEGGRSVLQQYYFYHRSVLYRRGGMVLMADTGL